MQNRESKKQESLDTQRRKRLEQYAKHHGITVEEVERQIAYAEKIRQAKLDAQSQA